jgi:hypothetical protein
MRASFQRWKFLMLGAVFSGCVDYLNGIPCETNSDCGNYDCVLQVCLPPCSADESCTSGQCVTTFQTDGTPVAVCSPECSSDADCPHGHGCNPSGMDSNYQSVMFCTLSCSSNSDCGSDQTCSSNGQCLGGFGANCSESAPICGEGPSPICLLDSNGNGTCTSICNTDGECSAGFACIANGTAEGQPVCLPLCSAGCSAGWSCMSGTDAQTAQTTSVCGPP